MKLKYGCFYLNGRAEPRGPMREPQPRLFQDQHHQLYNDEGLMLGHVRDSTANIVHELTSEQFHALEQTQ